jgi:hypothetical protein
MTQLTAAVSDTATLWTVDVLPDAPYVQVEDELVAVESRFPGGIYTPTGATIPPKIRVDRAEAGTTAASHANGSTLTPVYGAGTSGGGGLTVDNQSDPPAEVTTLIAPGADLSTPGEAELVGSPLSAANDAGVDTAWSDDTLDYLLRLVGPSGDWPNNTQGWASFLVLEDENGRRVYEFDAYGDFNLRGSAGMGPSAIFLRSADHPNALVQIFSGSEDHTQGPLMYRNGDVKAGFPLFRIVGKGAVMFGANAAPIDGEINAGECGVWFDDTDGAAKLMFKGKSANGTIVTGEVALA